MHELSICQSLLDQVSALAALHGALAVDRVQIEVGAISGVEPALLRRAFNVARIGSCAAQARLMIDVTPVVVRCGACGRDTDAEPNRVLCGHCDDYRVSVIRGEELRLREVHLRIGAIEPLPEPIRHVH